MVKRIVVHTNIGAAHQYMFSDHEDTVITVVKSAVPYAYLNGCFIVYKDKSQFIFPLNNIDNIIIEE